MDREHELYHHGIKGMKWGVRRYQNKDGSLTLAGKKRYAIDSAFEEYEREIEDIEKPYKRGQNLSKADMDREAAVEKKFSDAVATAKREYKEGKKARKTAIKETTKALNKEARFAEKLVYNNATRKLAAKYIVDHNMSVTEATKKAKGAAWRNSVALVAACGALSLASLKMKG